ncbi:hypothetical protein SE17_23595 [Kouleothrix aurantiaca]|uniref:Uncharacterized protein n=1 Tax=Kouleothrix aurantiaca TaxID=186479 RepID=A0A0P9F3B5_9CHLR|nr:hypothetical protein SE17_23595 [Kouleothrix aurantiaca]
MNTRPRTYTIAAIIHLVASLLDAGIALSLLPQGAATLDSVDGPGYVFTIIGLILGLAGIFSAFGVWRNQKWGVILTIILRTFAGLTALPGLFFAEGTLGWKIAAWWTVLSAIVIIALLLWPTPKPAPVSRAV